MNSFPSLTVIIPTYNDSSHVERHLFELGKINLFIHIIIVDDCSDFPHSTHLQHVFTRYFSTLSLSLVRNTTNLGVLRSVRSVLRLVHTEYCFFISADDFLDYSHLPFAIKQLSDHPAYSAYLTSVYVSIGDVKRKRLHPQHFFSYWILRLLRQGPLILFPKSSKRWTLYLFLTQLPPGGNFVLYRTRAYLSVSTLFDESRSLVDLYINLFLAYKYGIILDLFPRATFVINRNSFSSRHRNSPREFLYSALCVNSDKYNALLPSYLRLLWASIILVPWFLQAPTRLRLLPSVIASLRLTLHPSAFAALLLLLMVLSSPFAMLYKLAFYMIPSSPLYGPF